MSGHSMMLHSPSSSQSDSDNSESSIDISRSRLKPEQRDKMKCCWKMCGVEFDTLELLANHVTRQHAASGPGGLFYCGWEGCTRNQRGFNARYKMLVHVRTHTNEKPHKCHQCDKSFSRAENLKIHSRSHSGEKPYVCTVPGCGKAYSNSSDRFKHSRTHQVEKPYCCKVPGCPKRYTDPSSLRKHVKTYKHFVNENNINNSNSEYTILNEDHVRDHRSSFCERIGNNEPREPCNCPHFCSNNRLSQETDYLDRESYEVQENVINLSWKRIDEAKEVFKEEKLHQHFMDIDMPLDLSIHRFNV
ncbi:zinc finger protein GLIS2 homolog isoform X2 [Harmonia axyridis]|nr:zinc finger protein GLIS2 homolog isoform X2 [Harmonia axyridis]XP_045482736.1 zinc finger protein GLIS2 homolog isoform X2 [Harmonia axyridis]